MNSADPGRGFLVVLTIVWFSLARTSTADDGHARFPDYSSASEPCPVADSFHLSAKYPSDPPLSENLPWLGSFASAPIQYLEAVRAYVLDGNVDVDWQGDLNKVRQWYHVPWLHDAERGRECIHGLTSERHSRRQELYPLQVNKYQNWGVAMYNPAGGYVIGQVWEHETPDPWKARFPQGTIVVKLLFTEAPVCDVPYLLGSKTWYAMIHEKVDDLASRRVKRPLRLLQLDVAVRDDKAETGWVFGTFVYDGDAKGDTPWDRLVPVGLMWGNDPGVTPERLNENPAAINQTWLNPKARRRGSLGWAGRLNGPVDNPLSSCLSCHSTAQYPARTDMAPSLMGWFRNLRRGEPFNLGAVSLDYSLQLAQGIQNFCKEQEGNRFPAEGAADLCKGRSLLVAIDSQVRPAITEFCRVTHTARDAREFCFAEQQDQQLARLAGLCSDGSEDGLSSELKCFCSAPSLQPLLEAEPPRQPPPPIISRQELPEQQVLSDAVHPVSNVVVVLLIVGSSLLLSGALGAGMRVGRTRERRRIDLSW